MPKTSGPSGVAGSANFPVRNGQTTGTAVADPVGPGSFSCPSGQRPFLDAVSYSNTQITDQFGNTLHATPDPISATVHVAVPLHRNRSSIACRGTSRRCPMRLRGRLYRGVGLPAGWYTGCDTSPVA